eukprot:1815292-Prymnesium_polylepis.1
MSSRFEDFSADAFEQQMRVNFTGPVTLTRLALPHLRASRGVIGAVSSILGVAIAPRNTGYCGARRNL